MMKTLFLLLFTISSVMACTKSSTKPTNTYMPPKDKTDTLTYLALGDSYTIGESVDVTQSFPFQLSGMLPNFAVTTPKIIAKTGWTTDELIEAINDSDVKSKTYDMVTLLIGVNDQYRGYSKDNYREKFAAVLQTAIKFAGGNKNHVFVLSIPDYGVTPFAHGDDSRIGPDIDKFNEINLDESNKAGVHYTDITPISKLAANDATLIADDGLHPSAKMYLMWAEKLKPTVVSAFGK